MILIHFEGLGRAAAPPVAILLKIDDDDLCIYHWLSVLMISLNIIVLLHLQWPLIGTLIKTPAGLSDLNYFWSDSLSMYTALLYCALPVFLQYEAKYHTTVHIFNHIVNHIVWTF